MSDAVATVLTTVATAKADFLLINNKQQTTHIENILFLMKLSRQLVGHSSDVCLFEFSLVFLFLFFCNL